MSEFVTEAIMLHKKTIKDKVFSLELFTRDFWKIHCWYTHKHCFLDYGMILQVEIQTKIKTNTLKRFKIVSAFPAEGCDLEMILRFLTVMNFFRKASPEGVPSLSLFWIYKFLFSDFSQKDSEIAYVMWLAFLLLYSGVLDEKEKDTFFWIMKRCSFVETKERFSSLSREDLDSKKRNFFQQLSLYLS